MPLVFTLRYARQQVAEIKLDDVVTGIVCARRALVGEVEASPVGLDGTLAHTVRWNGETVWQKSMRFPGQKPREALLILESVL